MDTPTTSSSSAASVNLTDHFLIAMPAMTDPFFARSLVFVCEHNEGGALGVIVNRPLDMTLATLFEKIDISLEAKQLAEQSVYFGGPVQTDRGFVLHRPHGDWQSSLAVNAQIALTSSRDILSAVGKGGEPRDMLVTLGYAGWGAGQLENELAQNGWLTVPAEQRILFDLPYEQRLDAAMQLLGIDFAHLADEAGHA
jgi:putative transcriptional regulator